APSTSTALAALAALAVPPEGAPPDRATGGKPAPNEASGGKPAPDREAAAPGSSFVLPANPLSDLSDQGLRELVECVIYEDSGVPREADDVELLTPRPEPLAPPAAPVSEGTPAKAGPVSEETPAPARPASEEAPARAETEG